MKPSQKQASARKLILEHHSHDLQIQIQRKAQSINFPPIFEGRQADTTRCMEA